MIEVELKLAVPDRATFEHLDRLENLAGYRLAPVDQENLRDQYLDTADRALLRAGYACRLRFKGDAITLSLKELGGADATTGVHRRAEHQLAVPAADPATWPDSPARRLVAELSNGGTLVPLLTLDQTRRTRLVYPPAADAPPVAELSLDSVTLESDTYYELEIELRPDGQAADLETLGNALRTTWNLQPEPRSKFERALALIDCVERAPGSLLSAEERARLLTLSATASPALQRRARIILLADQGHATADIAVQVNLSPRQVRRWRAAFREQRMDIFPPETTRAPIAEKEISGPTPPQPAAPDTAATLPFHLPDLDTPGILPDDPMSEAGRKTLWFHFVRMLRHEHGTRLGDDIEELHDMRVATRRMRAAIRVFGDFFDPDAIRPFVKGIRRVTRALGPVRDLDVFEQKASQYLRSLPDNARDGLDPLLDTWRTQRRAARKKMLAFLDSARYREFVRAFADFLQTPGAGAAPIPPGKPVPYQVRHVAPRLIYTRYEAVRAYETVLADAPVETLHALRIDCKYLRYTLEFLSEVLGEEGKLVIQEVKKMQDHLGDLNDAQVAIELLNAFLQDWDDVQAGVPLSQRRSVEGVVTYLAARHAEKHQLLTSFPETWANFNRDEMRRWLALAVAAL